MSSKSCKAVRLLYKAICFYCENQLYTERYVPREGKPCLRCGNYGIMSVSPPEVKIEQVDIDEKPSSDSDS